MCKYEDTTARDKSRETSPLSDDMVEQAEGGGVTTSFSSPSINTLGLGDSDDESEMGSRVFMTHKLMSNRKRVRVVTQDFHAREPGKLSLRVRAYILLNHAHVPLSSLIITQLICFGSIQLNMLHSCVYSFNNMHVHHLSLCSIATSITVSHTDWPACVCDNVQVQPSRMVVWGM